MPWLVALITVIGLVYWFSPEATGDATGYVEIKSVPAQHPQLATLALGSTKLDRFKSTPVVLRLPPGSYDLMSAGFWRTTYCSLQVRKHRITTATLFFDRNGIRCRCLNGSPSNTDKPVCT